MVKNIFVLALDPFNLELLKGIRRAEQFRFHGLLDYGELVYAREYPIRDLLERAENQLHTFHGSIDGLIAYWDFPTSTMAPVLRRKFDLPGPSLESVLRCEHKYWSRVVQRQIVPGLIPRFWPIDPFLERPLNGLDIAFPFWLKPVRAHSSHLGFRIESENDFTQAVQVIRQNLPRYAEPFNFLFSLADLPPQIAALDGYHCIAEEIISAACQCTLEGYVYRGQPRVYGIVDSLRSSHHSAFSRYQYPSALSKKVQRRMSIAAQKAMQHIGFDNGPFNMEFFYDEDSNRLSLLEINARISKSHCPLFAMVEGTSHHEVAVNLAVGQRPQFPRGEGPFECAAKFMLRHFDDARVLSVPGKEQISQLQQEMPETQLHIHVKPGDRLSDLRDQDSYSYEYGTIFMGGRDSAELENKYRRCIELLNFEFASCAPGIDRPER